MTAPRGPWSAEIEEGGGGGTALPLAGGTVTGTLQLASAAFTGVTPAKLTIAGDPSVGANYLPVELHASFTDVIDAYSHSSLQKSPVTLDLYRSRGTMASPLPLQAGDFVGTLNFGGYVGTDGYKVSAQIACEAIGNWSNTDASCYMNFALTISGSNSLINAMALVGNVGIVNPQLGTIIGWSTSILTVQTPDAGFSRLGPASVGLGNGGSAGTTGTLTLAAIILSAPSSPASNAAGTPGQLAYDTNYMYVCISSGVWKRSALTGGY